MTILTGTNRHAGGYLSYFQYSHHISELILSQFSQTLEKKKFYLSERDRERESGGAVGEGVKISSRLPTDCRA